MKHSSWKRFLALALCLMLVFGNMSFAAWADEGIDEPAEPDDPVVQVPEEDLIEEPVAEAEDPISLPTETDDDEIEATVSEEEIADPEAEPVAYDLWVCGEQVTDSNKNKIAGSFGLKFDPATSTLTIASNVGTALTNPAKLINGAVIYSELPDLTIYTNATSFTFTSDTADKLIYVNGGNLTISKPSSAIFALSSESAYYGILVENGNLTLDCYLQITAPAAEYGIFVDNGDLLLGKVTINYSTGPKDCVPVVLFESTENGVGIANGTISGTTGLSSSTITINGVRTGFSSPTLQGDTVQNAMVTTDDANLTFGGKLWIYSKSAQFGVYVPNGTVTNNGDLDVDLANNSTSATSLRDADSCIYAEYGLTSNGKLSVSSYYVNNGYGIKVMNGPVTINGETTYIKSEHTGIYCGNGDVTITGLAVLENYHNEGGALNSSSGIYTANGGITLGGLYFSGGASWVLYANGPIHITSDVGINNTGDITGGHGIKAMQGGIVIDGNITSESNIGLDAGESTEGIVINGDAKLTVNGRYGAIANNGPITVNGNLDVRTASYTAVSAKGDITVEGNAYASASAYQDSPGNAIESTDGSINVGGKLTCYATKNPAYAKHDIRVGGDALFSFVLSDSAATADFGAKAENGEIIVGGNLTCKGNAINSLDAGTSITVQNNATITNAAEDSVGMNAVGFITFVSGKWDVSAGAAALRAGNGIEIAEGYGVTLPEGGKVSQADGLFTVTEADGTTVAAHAIIEEKVELVTVTFDLNYTGSEPITIQIPKGGSIDELPAPERVNGASHWVLLGWYTEAATGINVGKVGTQVSTETTFDEDTTVYAHWRLPGDVNGDGKVNTSDVIRLAEYVKARGKDVEVVTGSVYITGGTRTTISDVIRLAEYVKARGVGVEIH